MAGRKKGTPKTGGKVSGSKNERTKQWEALGEAIVTRHAERFNTILESLEEDKFSDKFLQVLEYFKPKLQRTDLNATVKQDLTINWHEQHDTDDKAE